MKNIFLVDMDETLLDFKRAERENFAYALSSVKVPFEEELYVAFHDINEALWKSLERGEIDRDRLLARRFEILAERFLPQVDAEALSLAYYRNFPSVCVPFPGATEFLRELFRRGRTFIVTNGGEYIQKEHIRLAGFAPYLSGVFISEEIGAYKPSSSFADYVEGHIEDYCRERAVWIGDSLTSDGACAKTRGIDFILFSLDGKKDYEGPIAKSYREVLALL